MIARAAPVPPQWPGKLGRRSENLRDYVRLPKGKSVEDWVATNLHNFFDEVFRLVSHKDGVEDKDIEYKWAGEEVTANEYLELAVEWMILKINNDGLMPKEEDEEYPADFLSKRAVEFFTQIFRTHVILQSLYMDEVDEEEALELQVSFKHLIFFSLEFDLIPENEFRPMQSEIDSLREEFNRL